MEICQLWSFTCLPSVLHLVVSISSFQYNNLRKRGSFVEYFSLYLNFQFLFIVLRAVKAQELIWSQVLVYTETPPVGRTKAFPQLQPQVTNSPGSQRTGAPHILPKQLRLIRTRLSKKRKLLGSVKKQLFQLF